MGGGSWVAVHFTSFYFTIPLGSLIVACVFLFGYGARYPVEFWFGGISGGGWWSLVTLCSLYCVVLFLNFLFFLFGGFGASSSSSSSSSGSEGETAGRERWAAHERIPLREVETKLRWCVREMSKMCCNALRGAAHHVCTLPRIESLAPSLKYTPTLV